MKLTIGSLSIVLFFIAGCSPTIHKKTQDLQTMEKVKNLEYATLGGGCFWCVEAVYQELEGVETLVSGYAGGHIENPTYKQICTGMSGHAEVVKIGYDPTVVSFAEILEIFWRVHDPTTLNKQGNDVGPQYRSVIYYHDEAQLKIAEASIAAATEAEIWEQPIVTELTALPVFYPAEAYHQDYYKNNPKQGYCVYIVGPKVEKFKTLFKEKVKKD